MPDLLRALGLKKGTFAPGSLPRSSSFADAAFPRGRNVRICIQKVLSESIVVTNAGTWSLGTAVRVTYENPSGRYRFDSRVIEADERRTVLRFPQSITTLAVFAAAPETGREAPRVEMTVPASWRLATEGRTVGENGRGVVTDLSRNGASIAIEPNDFIAGMQLELKIATGGARASVVVLTEIVRILGGTFGTKTQYGVRFLDITPADEEAISQLINRRQTERRTRGLI